MASRRTTRAEAEMAARLDTLDPTSKRYEVLAAAKAFKANWVELGQRLTTVRETQGYAQWGYGSFEAYCRKELQIRQDTANKLTRSFAFLRDHESQILGEKRTPTDLPALDVVDLLSQAQQRTKVSDAHLAKICETALDPTANPTRAQVMKQFRELDPEAFKPEHKPKPQPVPGANDMRKALLLAERLESLLAAQNTSVMAQVAQQAHTVVAMLREQCGVGQAGVGVETAGTNHLSENGMAH